MAETNPNGQFYEVDAPLNEVLSHFYHLRTPATAEPIVKHLSPNYEMLLVFNLGPPIRVSFGKAPLAETKIQRTAVIGPLRRMLNYELPPGANAIVANFTLNGFYRLFKVPMHEITGEDILDPDILIDKNCFTELWDKLVALSGVDDQIQMLRAYTATFVQQNEAATKPLLDSIPYFYNPAVQPVKAISADTKLTERTIQLRFQKYVGYSPKELLRFLRFKEVVYQMLHHKDPKVDLISLIETFGYHDQSHLIKDFNHFLGTTPQQFLKDLKNNEFCVSRQGKYY